jgi:transcriptional regulator GlxA family with amidase domain/YHS domain-containing protein
MALLQGGCAASAVSTDTSSRLTPPAEGRIAVAFLLAADAEVVDFAGPWGVFEYVTLPEREGSPFQLYTVAESTEPIRCSGGMTIVPQYGFATAPQPQVIIIPAMGEPTPALLDWIRSASARAELTVSICTGAIILAETGLLDGHEATTHHGAYGYMAASYPKVTVKRGARFVDSGRFSSAGGLTSGIDLALHIVERYFGRDTAERAALQLEYQGTGWKNAGSNSLYATRPIWTDDRPICPVCEMPVPKDPSLTKEHKGRTYYFCCKECMDLFTARPEFFE